MYEMFFVKFGVSGFDIVMSQEKVSKSLRESENIKSSTNQPGSGLRSLKTTPGFALFNFELYARPNKAVMIFGITALTGCVAFLAYMNISAENKKSIQIEDGTFVSRHVSKWD